MTDEKINKQPKATLENSIIINKGYGLSPYPIIFLPLMIFPLGFLIFILVFLIYKN